MSCLDQLGAELQEVGQQQQADMHAVDIGIGGDDDLVVTQAVDAVLDVECCLQQGKLGVGDDILGFQTRCSAAYRATRTRLASPRRVSW